MIPLVVQLNVQSNLKAVQLQAYDIDTFNMLVREEPITVDLTVSSTVQQFPLSANSNLTPLELHNETTINVSYYDVPLYEGEYTVTPSASADIELPTNGKLCEDNITVLTIPTYETHNEYGTTFYIAEV